MSAAGGCQTEVAYDTAASAEATDEGAAPAGGEAPPFEGAASAADEGAASEAEATEESTPPASIAPPLSEEVESDRDADAFFADLSAASDDSADQAIPPPTGDRYRDAARPDPPPWEGASGDAGPQSAEGQLLFGALDEPEASEEEGAAIVPEPAVAESDDEEDLDTFGSIIEDAYADLDAESSAPDTPESSPPQPKAPRPLAPSPASPAPPSGVSDTGSLLSRINPPSRPKPRTATPKRPSAATPDDPVATLAETIEPEPSDPGPWDLEDEAPAAPTNLDDRYGEVPDPAPMAFDLPPEPEPEPIAAPPRVASRTPSREPEIPPLDPVRVKRYNTRHIAWLLGGKLGLARLADSNGATGDEINAWANETAELAKRLRVDPPEPRGQGPIEERVLTLLQDSGRLGDALAREFGEDHAALVEAALKTNALLMLYDKRPELTGSVARAVAAACDRAGLPGYLWRPSIDQIETTPDVDAVREAVIELHTSVEAYLR